MSQEIPFSKPIQIVTESPETQSFQRALRQINDSQMVVVILPREARDIYPVVKKMLCCEKGLISQCITSKILEKRNMSVSGKIALQMSVKMGAEPWVLNFDFLVSALYLG